jgi:hypothetical protein
MKRKEGLDLARAGDAQTGTHHPPAPAPRHAHRQIGKGLDPSQTQDLAQPGRQPALEFIADQRRRLLCHPERVKRSADPPGCIG